MLGTEQALGKCSLTRCLPILQCGCTVLHNSLGSEARAVKPKACDVDGIGFANFFKNSQGQFAVGLALRVLLKDRECAGCLSPANAHPAGV